jgi:hypothetical protein
VKKACPFYVSFGGLEQDSKTPSCACTRDELGPGCRATCRRQLLRQSYTGFPQVEIPRSSERQSRFRWCTWTAPQFKFPATQGCRFLFLRLLVHRFRFLLFLFLPVT